MSEIMNLGICAGVKIKDKLYFSASEFNGIFEHDFVTEKTDFICPFDGEDIHVKTHLKAFAYNNQIWFIPYQGEYISCYDIKSRKIIMQHKVWNYSEGKYAFIDSVRNEEFVILVPRDTDFFLELDMKTQTIRNICKIEEENKGKFRSVVFKRDNTIEIISTNGSVVKSINTVTGEEKLLEANQEGNDRFLTAIQDDISLWLIPFNSKEVGYIDLRDYSKKFYTIEGINMQYYGGVMLKNWLIMFPFSGSDELLFWNKNNNTTVTKRMLIGNNEMPIPVGISSIESQDSEAWLGTENGFLIKVPYCIDDEIKITRVQINKKKMHEKIFLQYNNSSLLKKYFSENIVNENNRIDLDMIICIIKM